MKEFRNIAVNIWRPRDVKGRNAVFEHVARFPDDVPVHQDIVTPSPAFSPQTTEFLRWAEFRRSLRHRAKFHGDRSNRCRDMTIFRLFKMAAAAILDFSNFKFLTVGWLKRAELRRCAKLGQNRSKRGRDTAIFRFFKTAATAILDFEI